ncbi:MAG: hypothetical protein E6G03_12070 [Actinobacteria bacterium]|nr:MAG: hypothetical protein E6G03_12070 [Actinomycetota bacterium]
MADSQKSLPPGFKPWPPADGETLLREIEAAWASQQGRKGKHWCLQVVGTNPLSGYIVVMSPTGASET